MKFKWIAVLVLFSILFISAVSAESNVNATSNETDVVSDINVTFDEQMWEKNLSDINVEVPEEANGTFAVKINDEVIYNQTIVNKSFKVPITLPAEKTLYIVNIYPSLDCKNYTVSTFYNNIDLNITKTLKVMTLSPDIDYFHFPDEILQYGYPYLILTFPRSANGYVEFYIDDKFTNKTKAQPILYWEDDPFSKLSLGEHTLRVIYTGDTYYNSFNKTFNFNVTKAAISIPKTINIGHDDCISVQTLPNVTGTVYVYIDEELVYSEKTDDDYFVLSLEKYLKKDTREVKVTYVNKDFTKTKSQLVNMTYDFDVFSPNMIYGEENIIDITLPDTLNNNLLSIWIDGVKYSFKRAEHIVNNMIEVDVSKLSVGNHSMFISYAGDDRFAAKNGTFNFTISYLIMIPAFEIEYGDSSKVYLNLPEDAEGDLVVYVDEVFFKSSKLVKGYAQIIVDSLSLGPHIVQVSYNGADYNVTNVTDIITIEPKFILDYRFTVGEDKYIALEVSKDSMGRIVFVIDKIAYEVVIKNGAVRLSLSHLKAGEHEIDIYYYGDDGSSETYLSKVVTVYNPKIKIISADLTYKSANIKIKLLNNNNKAMTNKKVTVILNNKKYQLTTDKNGIATLNKKTSIKTKKAKITGQFLNSKANKNVKVKKIFLKVTKTSKKLILKASIKNSAKNKVITFKVNGKKIKAKTNKKGIAKVSVKKPKTSKVKIQATYLKDTVKA